MFEELAQSDLWRFEDNILRGLRGERLNDDWKNGLWWGTPWNAPLNGPGSWSSKNWPWLLVCCWLFDAIQRKDVAEEARAWETVSKWLIEEFAHFMSAEVFSRIYFAQHLLPKMILRHLAQQRGRPEIVRALQSWIQDWYTFAALLAVPAPQRNTFYPGTYRNTYACGMCGPRSFHRGSDGPPESLDYWGGGQFLWSGLNRKGIGPWSAWWGNEAWDRVGGPAISGIETLKGLLEGKKPEASLLQPLPGVFGSSTIVRTTNCVIFFWGSTTGHSLGSTDSIGGSVTYRADGTQRWLSTDDGRRGGGHPYSVSLLGTEKLIAFVPTGNASLDGLFDTRISSSKVSLRIPDPGTILYELDLDSSGVHFYSGPNSPVEPPESPSEPKTPPTLPSPTDQVQIARLLAAERLTRGSAVEDPEGAIRDVLGMFRERVPELF